MVDVLQFLKDFMQYNYFTLRTVNVYHHYRQAFLSFIRSGFFVTVKILAENFT